MTVAANSPIHRAPKRSGNAGTAAGTGPVAAADTGAEAGGTTDAGPWAGCTTPCDSAMAEAYAGGRGRNRSADGGIAPLHRLATTSRHGAGRAEKKNSAPQGVPVGEANVVILEDAGGPKHFICNGRACGRYLRVTRVRGRLA